MAPAAVVVPAEVGMGDNNIIRTNPNAVTMRLTSHSNEDVIAAVIPSSPIATTITTVDSFSLASTFSYTPTSTRRARTNSTDSSSSNNNCRRSGGIVNSSSILHRHHQDDDFPSVSSSFHSSMTSWSNLGVSAQQFQKRHQEEMQSILDLLEQLQQNCTLNDYSAQPTSSDDDDNSSSNDGQPQKEFAIRHFPNGDLFSGSIDSRTNELVYGRMTNALDMEIYEGPFQSGKRHGPGAVCCKIDGSAKFLGRYHEGEMHSGTLISSGFTYTGTFLNNNYHGIGTMVAQNGTIYQGQFVHGKYHGVGRLRTIMVDPHYDDAAANDKEGNDRSRDSSRGGEVERVYTGDFVDGLFSGFGTFLTDSVNGLPSFIGRWSEGKRIEGFETLPNGDVYEGKFVNERREGRGVLRVKTSGRLSLTKCGIWEGGMLKEDRDLSVEFENGDFYFGEHIDSVPHGFGKMDYADTGSGESSYIGSFINGVRHGEGRCFFHKTGEVYEGEWSCDEPIGIKIFQHDGPLVGEGASGELETVEPSLRPPIDQPRRCSNTSMGSFYNESSLDEVKWSLSGIDNVITDNGPQTTSSFRRSQSTSSDNLSQTIKALSIIDNFEVHIKRYQYQNGDVFEGCLDEVSGLRQGSGFYTEHRMGSSYDGDWKHGKRHGTGHLRLASGVEYSGEFYDDKIHGQGRLILINGSEYMGSFVNGLFHGHGVLEDHGHHRVYIGEFEDGERAGDGEETLADGSRFKGTYQQGKRNGFGILYGPDNSVIYRGDWRDDLQHGRGLLYRRHLLEQSCEENINDCVYDGDFFKNKFSGSGKLTYNDRTSIEGQWLDSRPIDGDWSITYPDGSKYYGFATFRNPGEKLIASVRSFSRGLTAVSHDFLRVPLPHGFGSLLHPSGRRDVGSFVYGEKTA